MALKSCFYMSKLPPIIKLYSGHCKGAASLLTKGISFTSDILIRRRPITIIIICNLKPLRCINLFRPKDSKGIQIIYCLGLNSSNKFILRGVPYFTGGWHRI